jgi:hypothetical protein
MSTGLVVSTSTTGPMPLIQLSEAIADAADRVLEDIGADRYRSKRTRHDFPKVELQSLKEYVDGKR